MCNGVKEKTGVEHMDSGRPSATDLRTEFDKTRAWENILPEVTSGTLDLDFPGPKNG